MMLILQNVSCIHPDKEVLFSDINFIVNKSEKVALIGNNGTGKSTLLKIIAGEIEPSAGKIAADAKPYYVPQIFGQYNHLSIAQALQIQEKMQALKNILAGDVSEQNFDALNDDWTLEERAKDALAYWQLSDLNLDQKMETLSGGQKTKVFLAGILIHQPEFVLLDEPGNHLDLEGRKKLYHYIGETNSTLIVVSHDKTLLNLLNTVAELSGKGITLYGGNYDFYAHQKQMEDNALQESLQSKEKELRKAREKERETAERQQRMDARGKSKQEKAGVARIMMNTLRNKAENSTSKLKSVHTEKISGLSNELQSLRAALPGIDKMKLGFDNSDLHAGKILFRASDINFGYDDKLLWKKDLNFEITSGERIALKGTNGSGKTSLIKMLLGDLKPNTGTIYRAYNYAVYIDQDYSLLDDSLTVYEQAQRYNTSGLEEHEIKIRLTWFLFDKDAWNKRCERLSGGERMRLLLCCLTISDRSPDIIVLDEPTNNLDIANTEILTTAINQYNGTLIVVSHDAHFLDQTGIDRFMELTILP